MKYSPCRVFGLGLLLALIGSFAGNATTIASAWIAPPHNTDYSIMPGWWDENLAARHYAGADSPQRSARVVQEPATPTPPDPDAGLGPNMETAPTQKPDGPIDVRVADAPPAGAGDGSAMAAVYFEDFELDDGGYTHYGTHDEWEWGVPTDWPHACASGTHCWGTDLDGSYQNSTDQSLLSPMIDLTDVPAGTQLTLSWWQAWYIESARYDPAYAEVSINRGAWAQMWAHAGGTTQQGWARMSYDVSAAAGGYLQVRWRLAGDSTVTYPGLYVDLVRISTPEPNLVTSHKSAPAVAAIGGVITYTVSLSNSGGLSTSNTSLVDPIPAGTAFAYIVAPPTAVYDAAEDQVEWTGTVSSGQSVDVTFAVTVDEAAECGIAITNTATITDPGIPSPVTVQHVAEAWGMVHHYEGFEADDGGFLAGGTNASWAWGPVGPYYGSNPDFPTGAHSPVHAWGTNLTGDYNNDEASYLTSPRIDLSAAVALPGQALWLEWWQWLRTEGNYDYASVEARGGSLGWTVIYGPEDGPVDVDWAQYVVDISRFAGVGDFQVRFRLNSDYSVVYPGWYIDDLTIYQCLPPPGLYLSPDTLEVQGCNGLGQNHPLNLANWTGADATFDLSYALANPSHGTIDGPPLLFAANGTGTTFDIALTPDLCLPDGVDLAGSIEASGNGYDDTSLITKTIFTGVAAEWLSAASTPQGTRFHAVAYHDGYLYQIGGESAWWVPASAVHRYDVASDAWTAVAAMTVGAYGVDAVTIDGHIYVPGGSDDTDDTGDGGTFLDALQVYSTATDSWSMAATMPVALAYASAVGYDGKLYVIGGQLADGTYTNSLYIYEPATDRWSQGASMHEARGYAAAAAIGDRIYVAGGFAGGSTVRRSMEIYHPAAGTWSSGPDLPKDWAPFGDGVLGDRYFVVFGGGEVEYANGSTGYACSRDAFYFDTVVGTWTALPDLRRCLYGSQGDGDGDRLYLVSGRASEGGWHMAADSEYLELCPSCTKAGWLQGYVYDRDQVSAPCQDAVVRIEPGDRDVAVDATGYYTVALVPFEYEASASAADYPEPDGPYRATIFDGAVSTQDFVLRRPSIVAEPTALTASAVAVGTATRYLTITNNGTYTLEVQIREVAPTVVTTLSEPQIVPASNIKSEPVEDSDRIEVEPQLLAQMEAEGASGYMIYFREQPDLSPAFRMDWSRRGWFVLRSLQAASQRSQARVRDYLDGQGADYKAFWIDNVIVVDSSGRDTLNGLMSFSEIEALRARRTMGLIEPEKTDISDVVPMAIEANISHVQADRVWAEGVTGGGIVVANIDTGVRYTHEALDGQYRGNLGGGSYDHNYDWWDPYGDHPALPADDHGHGSHTMGIMIGDDRGTNRIGMAPGAQWMACRGCSATSCADVALFECAQFMAAPWDLTGPGTEDPEMRPHVVNNSWGDCGQTYDGWYQGVVDAWHAAGIYPISSNGNASNCGYPEPPGLNTVGNPARYGNVTGVGSTGQSNGQYAAHSNWGPTDNPDTVNPRGYPDLKPQVLAPGVDIRSSITGGDSAYASYGGTSMSAPHVAGLVALMWQGAPCLVGDYATTETLLEQTATPIPYASGNGDEGPGNVPNHATGWGEINAFAAVRAAQDFCRTDWLPWVETGIVTGTVGAGDELVVEVTFSCDVTATYQAQPLQGTLRLAHDDPCEESVDVALTCFCIGRDPVPNWEKTIWINGEEVPLAGDPYVVRPGDVVIVVDYVGATFSETISSVLTETWSSSLELMGYDAGGIGTTTIGDNVLVWRLKDVVPSTLHPITKTFEVQHGDWATGAITESYRVEGALTQREDIVVTLGQYSPAISLHKRGPAKAYSGSAIRLTLDIASDGNFRGDAVLTDTLPPGMAYAGNLTYTYGRAWEDGNVVYWANDVATTAMPNAPTALRVLILTPDAGSGGGDVTALEATLGTCGVDVTTWDPDVNGEPSVADLIIYDVVVVGNDFRWNNMDKTTVGNALADYVDQGGKVIEGLYTQSFDVWGLAGRYMADGYSPFTSATADYWSSDTMRVLNPGHPIMAGVIAVSDGWGHQDPGLSSGADLIAEWASSGYNYIAASYKVVALNQLLHHNADWTGDVSLILCNSVDYLVSHASPPMPASVTISFDVYAPDAGRICNQADLNWGQDHTSGRHCVEVIAGETRYLHLPMMFRNR